MKQSKYLLFVIYLLLIYCYIAYTCSFDQCKKRANCSVHIPNSRYFTGTLRIRCILSPLEIGQLNYLTWKRSWIYISKQPNVSWSCPKVKNQLSLGGCYLIFFHLSQCQIWWDVKISNLFSPVWCMSSCYLSFFTCQICWDVCQTHYSCPKLQESCKTGCECVH